MSPESQAFNNGLGGNTKQEKLLGFFFHWN